MADDKTNTRIKTEAERIDYDRFAAELGKQEIDDETPPSALADLAIQAMIDAGVWIVLGYDENGSRIFVRRNKATPEQLAAADRLKLQ